MTAPPATAAPAIAVEGLTKVFGRFTAVDAVSFDVAAGEIFGLLGPNGAGKSTTIRMLCGLLASTAGTARVAGFDINRDPDRVRQQIGYMSQRFSLYRDLTIGENLTFFGGVYGLHGPRLRARREAVGALAGLGGLERRLAGTLSGAVQQRLALACALLHEPPILFLDEPSSGIDPHSRRLLWDHVRALAASGVTIVVTTHFMDEAEFCGRIGFISAGKLVALDTPAALKRQAVPEDVFEVSGVAREKLGALPGVRAVTAFGPRLHLFCEPGRFEAPALADSLRLAGCAPGDVRSVAPSLEDAFVRLVQTTPAGRPA